MDADLPTRLEWHGQHLQHISTSLRSLTEDVIAETQTKTHSSPQSTQHSMAALHTIQQRFTSCIEFYSQLKRDVIAQYLQGSRSNSHHEAVVNSRNLSSLLSPVKQTTAKDPQIERLTIKIEMLQGELIREQSSRKQAEDVVKELRQYQAGHGKSGSRSLSIDDDSGGQSGFSGQLAQELQSMRNESQKLRFEISQLEADVHMYQSSAEAMKLELENTEVKLGVELNRIASELAALDVSKMQSEEVASLEQNCRKLTFECEKMRWSLESERRKRAWAEESKKKLSEMIRQFKEYITMAKGVSDVDILTRLRVLETSSSTFMITSPSIPSEAKSLESIEGADWSRKYEELRSKYTSQLRTLDELQRQNHDNTIQLGQLQSALLDHSNENKSLKSKLADEMSNRYALEAKLRQSEVRILQLEEAAQHDSFKQDTLRSPHMSHALQRSSGSADDAKARIQMDPSIQENYQALITRQARHLKEIQELKLANRDLIATRNSISERLATEQKVLKLERDSKKRIEEENELLRRKFYAIKKASNVNITNEDLKYIDKFCQVQIPHTVINDELPTVDQDRFRADRFTLESLVCLIRDEDSQIKAHISSAQEDLKLQLHKIEELFQVVDSKREELSRELEFVRNERKQMKNEAAILNKEWSEIDQTRELILRQSDELRQRMATTENDNAFLRSQCDGLSATNKRLRDELEHVKQDHENLYKFLESEVNHGVKGASSEKLTATSEVQSLKESKVRLLFQMDKMKKRMTELERESETVKRLNTLLNMQNQRLKAHLPESIHSSLIIGDTIDSSAYHSLPQGQSQTGITGNIGAQQNIKAASERAASPSRGPLKPKKEFEKKKYVPETTLQIELAETQSILKHELQTKANLQASYESLRREMEDMKKIVEEKAHLEDVIDSLQKRINELLVAADEMDQIVIQSKTRFQEQATKQQLLEINNRNLQDEVVKREEEVLAYLNEIQSLRVELVDSKESAQDVTQRQFSDIQKSKTMIDRLQSQLEASKDEVNRWKQKWEADEKIRTNYQEQLSQLQSELLERGRSIQEISIENDWFSRFYSQVNQDLSKFINFVDSTLGNRTPLIKLGNFALPEKPCEDHVASISSYFDQCTQGILRLSKDLEESRRKTEIMSQELLQANQHIGTVNQECATLRSEMQRSMVLQLRSSRIVSSSTETININMDHSPTSYHPTKGQRGELERLLDESRSEMLLAFEMIEKQKQAEEKARQDADALRRDIHKLRDESQKLSVQLQHRHQEYQQQESHIKKQNKIISDKDQSLLELQEELRSMQHKIERQRKIEVDLRAKLEKLLALVSAERTSLHQLVTNIVHSSDPNDVHETLEGVTAPKSAERLDGNTTTRSMANDINGLDQVPLHSFSYPQLKHDRQEVNPFLPLELVQKQHETPVSSPSHDRQRRSSKSRKMLDRVIEKTATQIVLEKMEHAAAKSEISLLQSELEEFRQELQSMENVPPSPNSSFKDSTNHIHSQNSLLRMDTHLQQNAHDAQNRSFPSTSAQRYDGTPVVSLDLSKEDADEEQQTMALGDDQQNIPATHLEILCEFENAVALLLETIGHAMDPQLFKTQLSQWADKYHHQLRMLLLYIQSLESECAEYKRLLLEESQKTGELENLLHVEVDRRRQAEISRSHVEAELRLTRMQYGSVAIQSEMNRSTSFADSPLGRRLSFDSLGSTYRKSTQPPENKHE